MAPVVHALITLVLALSSISSRLSSPSRRSSERVRPPRGMPQPSPASELAWRIDRGQTRHAVRLLKKAVPDDPGRARDLLFQVVSRTRNVEAVLDVFQRARRIRLSDPLVHLAVAEARLRNGDHAAAIPFAERALGLAEAAGDECMTERAREKLRHLDPSHDRVQRERPPAERHPELEARLQRNPEDLQARLVYADWLQSQGDPRGELIALQVQLHNATDPAERARLERIDTALQAQHADLLLGDLRRRMSVTWEAGFIDRVYFSHLRGEERVLRHLFESLVALPSALLLRDLAFLETGDTQFFAGLLRALMVDPMPAWPPTLRRLQLGYGMLGPQMSDGVDLSEITRRFPGLESLDVFCTGRLRLTSAAPSRLRALSMRLDAASGAFVDDLHSNGPGALPDVETLVVEAYQCPPEILAGVFSAPCLARVKTVRGYGFDNWGPIASASFAPHLRMIDVSGCALDEDTLELFRNHLTALRELHHGAVSGEIRHAAATRLPRVRLVDTRVPGELADSPVWPVFLPWDERT